jgi:hypothetical protein
LANVTMVWTIAMGFEARGIVSPGSRNRNPVCYASGSAIVDLELAQMSECFRDVLTEENRDKFEGNVRLARTDTYMDSNKYKQKICWSIH